MPLLKASDFCCCFINRAVPSAAFFLWFHFPYSLSRYYFDISLTYPMLPSYSVGAAIQAERIKGFIHPIKPFQPRFLLLFCFLGFFISTLKKKALSYHSYLLHMDNRIMVHSVPDSVSITYEKRCTNLPKKNSTCLVY